jgi:iron complex transport system permease protein
VNLLTAARPAARGVPGTPGRVVRNGSGTVSLRVRPRVVLVSALLLALAVGIGALSLTSGDFDIALGDVVASLVGRADAGTDFIVLELRLPRVLGAFLVGAALGVSGAIFQSLTHNPLGSPDFIGLTVGSSTGALVMILVVGGSAGMVALGGLAGCLITSLAVYLLAFRGGTHGLRLVLVGVGVSAMLGAANSYLLVRGRLQDAATAQVWMIGSLNGRGWQHVAPLALAMAVLLPLTLAFGRRLSALTMGDAMASSLGVPVERSRAVLLVAAILLVAAATAASGPVAFVALAAPQLALRLTRSPDVGLVAPAAMGAVLMTGSDWAAQRMLAPTVLPVGVLTAAIGGVYLTWLLAHEWRRGRG